VQLGEKRRARISTLSGGQKQRLALALAFVNNPELVFLDEPTAGLDAHSRRELHAEIQAMRRDGHTVLLTTHHLDEAELLCDRIAIISKGQIVATGSPRELVSRSGRLQRVAFQADAPIPADVLAALPGLEQPAGDPTAGSLHTNTPGAMVLALVSALEAHGIGLNELHVQKATLEEVFVDLTEAPAAEITA
jgi:ABC-2 type transport system ATP-binding protein